MAAVIGSSLNGIIRSADGFLQLKKADVSPGDWIIVTTTKSVYRMRALADGRFEASGGWFDKKGLSSVRIGVSGCTWGGSAIMTRVVAACGLRMEFSNRLITSPVKRIVVIRGESLN